MLVSLTPALDMVSTARSQARKPFWRFAQVNFLFCWRTINSLADSTISIWPESQTRSTVARSVLRISSKDRSRGAIPERRAVHIRLAATEPDVSVAEQPPLQPAVPDVQHEEDDEADAQTLLSTRTRPRRRNGSVPGNSSRRAAYLRASPDSRLTRVHSFLR